MQSSINSQASNKNKGAWNWLQDLSYFWCPIAIKYSSSCCDHSLKKHNKNSCIISPKTPQYWSTGCILRSFSMIYSAWLQFPCCHILAEYLVLAMFFWNYLDQIQACFSIKCFKVFFNLFIFTRAFTSVIPKFSAMSRYGKSSRYIITIALSMLGNIFTTL